MKTIINLFLLLITQTTISVFAQNEPEENADDYLNLKWKQVATKMPDEWYGSGDAKRVAENVLLCQKSIGGWPKNVPFHHLFSDVEKKQFIKEKSEYGATFDNDATTTELLFLAKMYSHFSDQRYKQAFERGLDYIFISQYKNGGWPQFFPLLQGKNVDYASHITYNDNAMVNILVFLKDIFSEKTDYHSIQLSKETKVKAQKAFEKGVDCILKTQIIEDGKPTVWCAQHDAVTLAPAGARVYELESFSGGESAGIVLLLMDIENPSDEIISAVNGAVKWFENNKIEGIRLETILNKDGQKELVVAEDKTAPMLWARFYDLKTGKPFFCSRDGVKKNSLSEIDYERRNGYAWYTNAPKKSLEKYSKWKLKWKVE